jgi:hypothetical protein
MIGDDPRSCNLFIGFEISALISQRPDPVVSKLDSLLLLVLGLLVLLNWNLPFLRFGKPKIDFLKLLILAENYAFT